MKLMFKCYDICVIESEFSWQNGEHSERKNEWVQIKIITQINPFAMPVQVAKFHIKPRI